MYAYPKEAASVVAKGVDYSCTTTALVRMNKTKSGHSLVRPRTLEYDA